HVHDLLSDEGEEFPDGRELARAMGHRTTLSVPLLREGQSIGTISLRRAEVHPFSTKQIELLQTFASQAVIAIANVQLFQEVQAKSGDLYEALSHQTASANILSVIASSPTDIKPVLHAIVESACQLCEAQDAIVRLRIGDFLLPGAHHGQIPINEDKWSINPGSVSGRAILNQRPIHLQDIQSAEGDEFPESQERARRQGHRSILSVPLMREGESVGVIILRRVEAHKFSDKQVSLLQTFADQAVIAIENVRLFNETQETLERQTATADVLNVISRSPTDVVPVFDVIGERAEKLCHAEISVVSILEGDVIRAAGIRGLSSAKVEAFRAHFPMTLDRETVTARTIKSGSVIHIGDVLLDGTYDNKRLATETGYRSCLGVPMH
ncbi:MAG TPA: GAF domain-containing protein, partial [Nitrospira sp.]|nr:GAF domain-containing protein [Nitrospira sp.]